MANHALPTTSSLYTDVLTNLKDRIDDSLKMLDSVNTSPTNTPTNAIRWNSSTNIWEKYNGSSWVSLAATYSIATLKSTNLVGGNNTTLLGSIPYQSNTDTTTLLVPNTTTTRKFLRQTGTGTNGAIPVWDTILAADVPTLNQNTTGSAATLTTARTISGVSFNGSANINIEDRLGAAIASAATVTIGTAGLGDYIHITGTTTITSLGTATTAGMRRTLIFDAALTLTHNATSLICVGGVSIVTVAGMVIEVVAETTANWRVMSITHPSISATELGYLSTVTSNVQTQLNEKQATLVSGTNIKTINSNSILGSGDLVIASGISLATANSYDLGVGQTWQDVTASRALGTTYTNSTGKPIELSLFLTTTNANTQYTVTINGTAVYNTHHNSIYNPTCSLSIIIPTGSTYSLSLLAGTGAINKWSELR